VKCVIEPGFKGMVPVMIEIRMKDGRTFTKKVETMKGNPDKPLTKEEQLEKFMTCWKRTAKPMLEEKADFFIEMVYSLEELNDISQLIECLG